MSKVSRCIDLRGQRFGRLIVVAAADAPAGVKNRDKYWSCLCDCGNTHVASAKSLRHAKISPGATTGSRSCGCLQKEAAAASAKSLFTTHGHSRPGKVTTEYRIWSHMLGRCCNPTDAAYRLYGGRGITVCDKWRNSFEAFLQDVGKRPSSSHSIDRIDNNRGYEPGNVRWATQLVQARNQNRVPIYTFGGHSLTLPEWAEKTGITYGTLRSRLYREGWSLRDALTVDPSIYHKKDLTTP